MNSKPLVWDLPTRLCHWLFALSLTASLTLALTVDDDSPLFRYHMIFGLIAVFVLVLRILLGFVGSETSRFTSFPVKVTQIRDYFKAVVFRQRDLPSFPGNNPGSALAALAMFALVPALVATGLSSETEGLEDLHGLLAYALLGVIAIHLIGLLLHSVTRDKSISVAMISGRKESSAWVGLPTARPMWGLALLALVVLWSGSLWQGFDAQTGSARIPWIGTSLQLGEIEEGDGESGESHRKSGHSGDHDDKDDDN